MKERQEFRNYSFTLGHSRCRIPSRPAEIEVKVIENQIKLIYYLKKNMMAFHFNQLTISFIGNSILRKENIEEGSTDIYLRYLVSQSDYNKSKIAVLYFLI